MNRMKMADRRYKTDDHRNNNKNDNHNNQRRTSIDELENKHFDQVFRKIYMDEQTADIHFVCVSSDGQTDERVPAHKLLLSIASDGFKMMFEQAEPNQNVFQLDKISAVAFREFMQLFYMAKFRLNMANIATVMDLAKKYGNEDHLFLCSLYLENHLNTDNIVWGYELALRFGRTKMKEFCEKKIADHAVDVLKSGKFLECDRDLLEQVIDIDTLKCGEFDVLTACLAWAKASAQRKGADANDTQVLRQEFGDLLHKIRFRSISMTDFTTVIGSYAGLFAADELEHIIQMIVSPDFQSDKFNNKQRVLVRSNGGNGGGGNGGGDNATNERKSSTDIKNEGKAAKAGKTGAAASSGDNVNPRVNVMVEEITCPAGTIIECYRFDKYCPTRYYIRSLERTQFIVSKPGLELLGFECGLVIRKIHLSDCTILL